MVWRQRDGADNAAPTMDDAALTIPRQRYRADDARPGEAARPGNAARSGKAVRTAGTAEVGSHLQHLQRHARRPPSSLLHSYHARRPPPLLAAVFLGLEGPSSSASGSGGQSSAARPPLPWAAVPPDGSSSSASSTSSRPSILGGLSCSGASFLGRLARLQRGSSPAQIMWASRAREGSAAPGIPRLSLDKFSSHGDPMLSWWNFVG